MRVEQGQAAGVGACGLRGADQEVLARRVLDLEGEPGAAGHRDQPGPDPSELTESIGDSGAKDAVEGQMGIAIPADAIGEAVLYTITQPAEVDVNELVVRPTAPG
ncbi:hypothetical protein [Streptomyces scopuliridis]|uniref:hypothetical protein n=1 Tax=Streptomyces scopuliridis TaxID=452529 RepID=UPI0034166133